MKRFLVPAVLLVAILAIGNPADAVIIELAATINAAQEVPTNPSTATGFATFVLDDTLPNPSMTYFATVFGLDFTGMQTPNPDDNLVAAHIHAPGAPGVNAGVVFGFFGMPFNETAPNDVVVTPFDVGVGGTIRGKWDATEGNMTTLIAQLDNVRGGLSYINFHSMLFPGGEIRGQIEVVPEPGTLALLGSGLAGLGIAWRRFRRG